MMLMIRKRQHQLPPDYRRIKLELPWFGSQIKPFVPNFPLFYLELIDDPFKGIVGLRL